MLCLMICFGVYASAAEIVDNGTCGAEGDNVTWVLYDDGEIVISGEGEMMDYAVYYSGSNPSLHVEVAPYSQASLDENGDVISDFRIKKVTIKDGVTYIGEHAFTYMAALEEIIIPESVTNIGSYAFSDCNNLSSIDIPDSVIRLGDQSFYNCRKLNSVILSKGLQVIEYGVFLNCYSLHNIEFPNSLKTIGQSAFENCYNLTNISVPESVENLGWEAFIGCDNLIYAEVKNEDCFFDNNVFEEFVYIYGKVGSTAEEYAKKYKCNFRTNCTHTNTENYKAITMTCTTDGYTEGVYCKDCERWKSGRRLLKARHIYGDDVFCDVCNYEYIKPSQLKTNEVLQIKFDATKYERQIFEFYPEITDTYHFKSISTVECPYYYYIYVYDANRENLIRNYYGPGYVLQAGEKYNIEVEAWVSDCWYGDLKTVETFNIEAHRHEWENWVNVIIPSCGVAGVNRRECLLCDDVEEQYLESLEHNFNGNVCSICSQTYCHIYDHIDNDENYYCDTCNEVIFEADLEIRLGEVINFTGNHYWGKIYVKFEAPNSNAYKFSIKDFPKDKISFDMNVYDKDMNHVTGSVFEETEGMLDKGGPYYIEIVYVMQEDWQIGDEISFNLEAQCLDLPYCRFIDDNSDWICDVCDGSMSICVDETCNPYVDFGEKVYIRFVPTKTGEYTLSSLYDWYSNMYLYDSALNEQVKKDGGKSPSITYEFEEGKEYYWAVGFDDSNTAGTLPVILTFNEKTTEDIFKNITVLYDSGTLFIHGTGDIPSVDSVNLYPWTPYADTATELVITGVTSIGSNAFSGFYRLKTIIFDGSDITVGSNAFNGCTDLSLIVSYANINFAINSITGNTRFVKYFHEASKSTNVSSIPFRFGELGAIIEGETTLTRQEFTSLIATLYYGFEGNFYTIKFSKLIAEDFNIYAYTSLEPFNGKPIREVENANVSIIIEVDTDCYWQVGVQEFCDGMAESGEDVEMEYKFAVVSEEEEKNFFQRLKETFATWLEAIKKAISIIFNVFK